MSKSRLTAIVAFGVLAVFQTTFMVGEAHAQNVVAPATASAVVCFEFPARLPDAEVLQFLNDPSALLESFPSGGLSMSTRVRGLVGSSSNTQLPLLALLQSANSQQKSAIGTGMARAAVACEGSNLAYSQQIQQAAASVDDETFLAAFQTAQDDIQTAALGGGLTTAGNISGGPSNGTTGGFGDTALTRNTPRTASIARGHVSFGGVNRVASQRGAPIPVTILGLPLAICLFAFSLKKK